MLIERSKLGCFYLFLELHNDLLSDIFKKKKITSLECGLAEYEKWKFMSGTQEKTEHLYSTAWEIMHAAPHHRKCGENGNAAPWRIALMRDSPVGSGQLPIHPGDKGRPGDESPNPPSPRRSRRKLPDNT